MGRPLKKGLDYFSHDTNASNDIKLEPIILLYGSKGYAFYFMHLEYIYRETDLLLDVSDSETRRMICSKIQITEHEYEMILNSCIKRELFDTETYKSSGKLTSNGILKRASKVTEKRARMSKKYAEKGFQEDSAAETGAESPETILNNKQNKTFYESMYGRTYPRESYQEIMNDFEVPKGTQATLWDFIRHCQLNKHIITNDKLKNIIVRLYDAYGADEKYMEKMYSSIKRAIGGGHFDILEGRN